MTDKFKYEMLAGLFRKQFELQFARQVAIEHKLKIDYIDKTLDLINNKINEIIEK